MDKLVSKIYYGPAVFVLTLAGVFHRDVILIFGHGVEAGEQLLHQLWPGWRPAVFYEFHIGLLGMVLASLFFSAGYWIQKNQSQRKRRLQWLPLLTLIALCMLLLIYAVSGEDSDFGIYHREILVPVDAARAPILLVQLDVYGAVSVGICCVGLLSGWLSLGLLYILSFQRESELLDY